MKDDVRRPDVLVAISNEVDELVEYFMKLQLSRGVKLDNIKVNIGKNVLDFLIAEEVFDSGGDGGRFCLRRNNRDCCN